MAPSPTSPLVSATLHEDDTLVRIVLDRPKANIPVEPQYVDRYVDHILTSRDGDEGISAYLARRKSVREDR